MAWTAGCAPRPAPVPPEGGSCVIEELSPPSAGGAHVALCSALTPATNPPTSGPHYGRWPVFRVYDRPVPWGYLLHGLEHGVVVIAYNCPDGCPDEVAAATALHACVTRKPACPRPPVIVVPDPTLDVRFAAAAWGHALKARCFDPAAFTRFVADHADRGPESFADDCGFVDLEATGWCPQAP